MSLDRVPRDNPSCASSLTIEDDPAGAFVRPAAAGGPEYASWPSVIVACTVHCSSNPKESEGAVAVKTQRAVTQVLRAVLMAFVGIAISSSVIYGAPITLKDLFDGASVQSDDKVFEDWHLVQNTKTIGTTTVPPVGPEDIVVSAISPNGISLSTDSLIVATRQDPNFPQLLRSRQIFRFSYQVRVLSDLANITDNELTVPGLDNWSVDGTGFITINEFVQDKRKFIFNDPFGGGRRASDAALLDPTPRVLVVTEIELFSGALLEDTSQLKKFQETFSQTVVPEPSTLLLLGSGLAGLAGVMWRRHRP